MSAPARKATALRAVYAQASAEGYQQPQENWEDSSAGHSSPNLPQRKDGAIATSSAASDRGNCSLTGF